MANPKRFVLIGVGGYIAPRHLKAIKDSGGVLVAAYDPKDSVGIMDSYFPDCHFFTEFERFDTFVCSLDEPVDYLAICSPNYLHEAHVSWGLRQGLNVICEKPLVLDTASLGRLEALQARSNGGKVYSILQLRHHADILDLRQRVLANPGQVHDVELTYITSRGRWYDESWKGDERRSGGVVMNIGIHFFDMLGFLFGGVRRHEVQLRSARSASGLIELEAANVSWFLSVDESYLPADTRASGQRTYRNISVGGDAVEFSGGFTELHSVSYQSILNGEGFGLSDARTSIQLVEEIRQMDVATSPDDVIALTKEPDMTQDVFVHESAVVDKGAQIGAGTRVWHFVHVSAGARIGRNCSFGQNVYIANNVVIGDGVKIQNNVSVFDNVTLEDGVFCGPSMVFTNVINPRAGVEKKDEYRDTLVKTGASLGANCTIICGVSVGRFGFVGAGAVVTRDVPDYALVVGAPARRIGWMSEHGERLDLPLSGDGSARCPVSGIEYRLTADVVSRA